MQLLQIQSVKKYQPINKTYFLMGNGVRLMHSRFKVEIQATKLLQVAESSCAVKKSEEEKKQLGAFCAQLLHEVKIWHNKSRVFVKFNAGNKLLPNYHHCAHFYVDLSESNILNQFVMIVGTQGKVSAAM